MADNDTNAMIRQWLKDKGYSDREVENILRSSPSTITKR